jgi:hypothetical protein
MKEAPVESFSADTSGLAHADQEDWDLEMSPEFWRMIQQRRNQPTVPLRDVESALLNDECS